VLAPPPSAAPMSAPFLPLSTMLCSTVLFEVQHAGRPEDARAQRYDGYSRGTRWLAACALAVLVPCTTFAQAPFTIGTVTAQPGTMASGGLQVVFDLRLAGGGRSLGMFGTTADAAAPAFSIPFTIVNGANRGPVLALIAGVHGAEYPPILALQRARKTIDPKTLAGTVILVHCANTPSYLKRTVYYSPIDGQNLNRVFPGKVDGTLSERIAHALTKEIIERSDFVVDLHAGDANESLRPYSYWMTSGTPAVNEQNRQLALAFGLDHIVIDRTRPTDPANSVYLANTAITRGKPALTIESGGLGMSDEESIARIERGIAGVMRHLKMRPTGPDPVSAPIWLGRSQVVTSPVTGIFYPLVERTRMVSGGTLLGYVTDFFGTLLTDVRAPFTGEVLYIIGTPAINKGEPIAFIGALASPDEIKR
jgi:predicted deacylase